MNSLRKLIFVGKGELAVAGTKKRKYKLQNSKFILSDKSISQLEINIRHNKLYLGQTNTHLGLLLANGAFYRKRRKGIIKSAKLCTKMMDSES